MSEDNRGTHRNVWERVNAYSSLAIAVVGFVALIFTGRQVLDSREESRTLINEMRAENQRQIAEMHNEAQAQHLATIFDQFNSPARLAIRRAFAEERVDKGAKRLKEIDPEEPPVELDEELEFCDHIALLTDRGYLDRHDVWVTFEQWLFYLYHDARPYLDNLQSPADYAECRKLVESVSPFETTEAKSQYDHPTEDEIYQFYMDSIDAEPGQAATHRRQSKKP